MITKYLRYVKEQLDLERLNENKIYRLVHPNYYEYIIVISGNRFSGFATRGYQTEEMLKNNVNAIGTIWGPMVGDLLYESFIKCYGPIIPSRNESDLAKISWARKMKDTDYIITQIKGIGFYSVYEEEKILNNIVNINPKIKNKLIILNGNELSNFDEICKEIQIKHDYMTQDFMGNKNNFYTFGESVDRFEWMSKVGSKIHKNYLSNTPKDFFINYKIPFAYPNNKKAEKFLSMI